MRKILTCFEIFICNSAKLKKYKYLYNRNVNLQFEFENSILHLLSLYIHCRCAVSKYIEISFQYLIKTKSHYMGRLHEEPKHVCYFRTCTIVYTYISGR